MSAPTLTSQLAQPSPKLPQPWLMPHVLRRNGVRPARPRTSVVRVFRHSVQRPVFHTGALASPTRSTCGASRPARISRARAHPASIDIEVQPSRFVQILREARVHRVPVHCADARRCSVQPTREGSSGDAPRTAESSSPGTHAGSCRSLRSQIAFALGLENGERSTARPNARIESSRCLAKMLSRSWIRYL